MRDAVLPERFKKKVNIPRNRYGILRLRFRGRRGRKRPGGVPLTE